MGEVANYNITPGLDYVSAGTTNCRVCGFKKWLGAEELAWICNQDDKCRGFMKYGTGGWLHSVDAPGRQAANSSINYYRKISTNWRKANNPDTSNPSILPNPTTRFKARDDSTSGDVVSVPPGLWYVGATTPWGGGLSGFYTKANTLDTYTVPLGWKFMISDSNIGEGDVEGYWDRGGAGVPGSYRIDQPNYHGLTNKDDAILVQNIGFDVAANWNNMGTLSATDQNLIKDRFCKANVDNPLCTSIMDTYCLSSMTNIQSSLCASRLSNIVNLCLRDRYTAETVACRSTNPFLGPVFTVIDSNYKRYNRLRTFENLGKYSGASPRLIGQSTVVGACNAVASCPGYAEYSNWDIRRMAYGTWNVNFIPGPATYSASTYMESANAVPDAGETLITSQYSQNAKGNYFRWVQKVRKDCVYTDPGPSTCTVQCTRTLNITQQGQMGGTACPANPTCNNNEGQCCTNVLVGSAAGRGSFSNTGSGCTLTCYSGYWGTNCMNWCPRTGGWGKVWPTDGSVTGCEAYTYQGGTRVIVQPTSKSVALLFTNDGWGGQTSAGTPNSSCNGSVTCSSFPNGLGYWYTSGSDPERPCRYIACNTDIPIDRGYRDPFTGCQATCNALGNGLGRWTGASCSTLSCNSVAVTQNGVTSTAGTFGGTDCSTLTCNSGYTLTTAGNRCCPTPSGVTNPQIYTDAQGYCIVNNCPRLANGHGRKTAVPNAGCTGTPVCDRLPSGKGGWTGSDCGTLTCDTDLAPYATRSGADCLTVTCNTITNGTYAPPGVCTGTPTCNRLPNNLGIYQFFSSGSTRSCSPTYLAPLCDNMTNGTRLPGPNNDCTQIICNTELNGVRTGASCTLSCNPGYTLSKTGIKCCKTVSGATSYDDTTCNPVSDCILKPAGPDDYWSPCSATTCGGSGTQTRTRVVDVQAAYGGRACAATLNRSVETDPVKLANGALTETRNCTKTCTDMKELPQSIADARCTSDTNCKIIGFEEQMGFSLHNSTAVPNTVSSPFDYDTVFVKSGTTVPATSGTVVPSGYTAQSNKRYSNVRPLSTYANPAAVQPDDCVRVEDQCTLDTKCVGFDLNSTTNLCTRLLTDSPADISNVQLWTNTTDATRTTYLKSQNR